MILEMIGKFVTDDTRLNHQQSAEKYIVRKYHLVQASRPMVMVLLLWPAYGIFPAYVRFETVHFHLMLMKRERKYVISLQGFNVRYNLVNVCWRWNPIPKWHHLFRKSKILPDNSENENTHNQIRKKGSYDFLHCPIISENTSWLVLMNIQCGDDVIPS